MARESIRVEVTNKINKFKNVWLINMVNLQNEIVHDSPVDTGFFKTRWSVKAIDKNRFFFFMENNVEYGAKLWNGFKIINGKSYGSKKGWGLQGGQAVVNKHIRNLEKDFRNIK